MSLRVFVSYCHQDANSDPQRLKVLVDMLEARASGSLQLMVDYRHPEAAIGADINAYMRRIDEADAVLLLLTPTYCVRVRERGKTGVYAEFTRIYDRLLDAQDRGTFGVTFLLLPIVFSGTPDTSVPDELKHLVYRDLTWLHVIPERYTARSRAHAGQPPVRPQVMERLNPFIEEIVGRTAAISATKRVLYREQRDSLFKEFLFVDTKSRWNDPDNARYLESLFVKTSVFMKVREGGVSILVGRKGAGKSTIAHVLPALLNPPPLYRFDIVFDELCFDICYNILMSRPAQASDIKHAFSPILAYQLLWDTFFHLYYAWSIHGQLPRRAPLSRLLRRILNPTDPIDRAAQAPRVLFVYVFEQLMNYVAGVLDRVHTDALSAAVARFSAVSFRNHVIGRAGWSLIQTKLSAINGSGDRVVATLDGFDTMVDYLIRAADHPLQVARFESELILALVQLVLNRRPARAAESLLYTVGQFCITLPYDRLFSAQSIDRDRYQFRGRIAAVEWSGIELSALIRKRLALYRKNPDPRGPQLSQRLAQLMETAYSEIPDEVSFQFGSAQYRLPLFCYVLRHTLWRPRDVLYYYATILTAAEPFRRQGRVMPGAFIRQLVAGATYKVVEDEFINEFATMFPNLRSVLTQFRRSEQVVSYDRLHDVLDTVQFDVPAASTPYAELEAKLEVLYNIGFLGVVLDRQTEARLSAHRHAFVFNEGPVLQKLGRDVYRHYRYAIHPVFVEYLHLATSTNDELILPLDWTYLEENERLRQLRAT